MTRRTDSFMIVNAAAAAVAAGVGGPTEQLEENGARLVANESGRYSVVGFGGGHGGLRPLSIDPFQIVLTTLTTTTTTSNVSAPMSTTGGGGVDSATIIVAVVKSLTLMSVIFSAIFGNILVIVSVFRCRRLRVVSNSFLVSLAFADLLVAVFVMPFSATQEVTGRWLFGRVACDVFNANDVLFSTASLLHLCFISLDRYTAITAPFRYETSVTPRRVGTAIAAIWITSAVISHIPIHLGWYATADDVSGGGSFRDGGGGGVASETTTMTITAAEKNKPEVNTSVVAVATAAVVAAVTTAVNGDVGRGGSGSGGGDVSPSDECAFRVNPLYGVVSSAISFWIPAIIMLLAYFKLYREASRQERIISEMTVQRSPAKNKTKPKKKSKRTPSSASAAAANASRDEIDLEGVHSSMVASGSGVGYGYGGSGGGSRFPRHHRPSERDRRVARREHKAAKTLGVIVGAFLLCWLPFFLWYLATTMCDYACYTPPAVSSALFWIGYANSALNPAIYAFFNRDFRDAFRRMLGGCCCCCPPTGSGGKQSSSAPLGASSVNSETALLRSEVLPLRSLTNLANSR